MQSQVNMKLPILFIWLADRSISMKGDRLAELNRAIGDTVPKIKQIVGKNALFPIRMGVIQFNDAAEWYTHPTDLNSFQWIPIPSADGGTSLVYPIKLADEKIRSELGQLAVPPILVLVSDGEVTGYEEALKEFKASPWGGKSRRRAVAIATSETSASFVDFVKPIDDSVDRTKSPRVVRANDATDIARVIQEVALAVLLETVADVA